MAEVVISGELAERLQALAAEQNRSVEEVLDALLVRQKSNPSNWALAMARMAEADTDIEWNDTAEHLSERSREILEKDFPDYLLKRARDNDAEQGDS
jgi:hypothetical protein